MDYATLDVLYCVERTWNEEAMYFKVDYYNEYNLVWDSDLFAPWAYDSDVAYYARGFGLLSLQGVKEYSEFSKAVFGDETVLGLNPDLIYGYNDEDEF